MPRYNGGFIGHDGLDAPDAPTIGTPSAGSTQADVAFTAGAAGTTATTEFVATTNDGIGATGTSSPITITGLTNGTSYTARVYAKNSHGTSAASEASASFTPLAIVINDLFQTHVFDTTGAELSINNGINLSNKGGLVWLKSRSNSADHELFDTERGVNKILYSNANTASTSSSSSLTSFNTNGFTLNNNLNANVNNRESVSWTFRKQPKFFDIVTYTGNGSNRTIAHNLGSVPGMMIVKRTDNTSDWAVYHRGLNGGTNPAEKFIRLNLTNAQSGNAGYWNNTEPTDSVFSVGTNAATNSNGATYVAYLFAHNNSDGGFGPDSEDIIKCGAFATDSSGNATVTLGFEPQFVMNKVYDAADNWTVADDIRGFNVSGDQRLYWNLSNAEAAATTYRPTSTGFTVNSGETSKNFIYMAIRRPDMSTPTLASDVFAIDLRDDTDAPMYKSGFVTDMSFYREVSAINDWYIQSRLTGVGHLHTHETASENTNFTSTNWDYMNGFYDAGSINSAYQAWMWKRAKSYFDVVAEPIASNQMSGPASSSYNPSHNLGVVPEMIWVKDRDNSNDWAVYHSALGTSKKLVLNSSAAESSSSWAVAADNFNYYQFGNSTGNAICYLFATAAGVSKVGSYTGSGSDQTIDCGFTNGAKFVLIKVTSDSDNWVLFDTTRGLVAGNDTLLSLNLTHAQVTNTDYIDPHSSGFAVPGNDLATNKSSETYIFYAIANDPS